MKIQRKAVTAHSPTTRLTSSKESSPSEPEDSVTLGQRVKKGITGAMTWFLRRKVPTTFPEITDSTREDVKSKLKAGDVIVTNDVRAANLGHFGYWTVGANYTHAALYDGNGKVVEQQAEGFSTRSIDKVLEGPVKFSVVRPPYKSDEHAAQVVKEARKLEGIPFDFKFDSRDNSAHSCSEFIEIAMKAVDPKMEVPDIEKFGYLTTVADGFTEMDGAEMVVDGKSQYWKNQVHHWPVHLATAVGAGVGAVLGGPLGAGVGGLLAHEGFLAVDKLLG